MLTRLRELARASSSRNLGRITMLIRVITYVRACASEHTFPAWAPFLPNFFATFLNRSLYNLRTLSFIVKIVSMMNPCRPLKMMWAMMRISSVACSATFSSSLGMNLEILKTFENYTKLTTRQKCPGMETATRYVARKVRKLSEVCPLFRSGTNRVRSPNIQVKPSTQNMRT